MHSDPSTMSTSNGGHASMLTIGERVLLDNRLGGLVRYFGDVDFSRGVWVGVELDEPVGKNNGTVRGQEYFKCPEKHGIFTLQSRLQLQPRYLIGDRVVVQQAHVGTVRFVGETTFGHGQWIGVELVDEHGKNDGSVEGHRYFTCKPKHGVFMRPRHVRHAVTRVARRSSFGNSSKRLAAALKGAPLNDANLELAAARSRSNTRTSEADFSTNNNGDVPATSAGEEGDAGHASDHPRLQEENERLKTQLARVKSELVKERKAVQEAIPTAHILGDEAQLKREIVEQRNVIHELAEMLETAKHSLVTCADRESELRSELARTRALAETLSWRIDDVSINNDALQAEREEAIEQWNEAEDRRAALEMDLFDCKREMLDAMKEIGEISKRNRDLMAYIASVQGGAAPSEVDVAQAAAAANEAAAQSTATEAAARAEADALQDDAAEAEEDPNHSYPDEIPDEAGVLEDDIEVEASDEHIPDEAGVPSDDEILTVDVTTSEAAIEAANHQTVKVDQDEAGLFCTTCECYGHAAEDCDDTETF